MQEVSKPWTIREVLSWTTKRFVQAGIESALLDAQLLLCRILSLTKVQLYIEIDKPVSESERTQLREFIKKRLAGTPVAYILNEKYWHELKFYVDERVLIPRPETESMLDFILMNYTILADEREKHPKVIFDFCTGSGCIAVSLAKKFPDAQVIGIDISADALEVARKNAELNSVSNVTFLNADVTQKEIYQNIHSQYGKADIIVANPPYVSEKEWGNLDITVKNFEPKIALVCEQEGLSIGKKIFSNVNNFSLLNENSIFIMELSDKQPQQILAVDPPVKPRDDNAAHPSSSGEHRSSSGEHRSSSGLTGGSTHPRIVQNNCPILTIPKNEWFVFCDLERKERFLAHINKRISDEDKTLSA